MHTQPGNLMIDETLFQNKSIKAHGCISVLKPQFNFQHEKPIVCTHNGIVSSTKQCGDDIFQNMFGSGAHNRRLNQLDMEISISQIMVCMRIPPHELRSKWGTDGGKERGRHYGVGEKAQ